MPKLGVKAANGESFLVHFGLHTQQQRHAVGVLSDESGSMATSVQQLAVERTLPVRLPVRRCRQTKFYRFELMLKGQINHILNRFVSEVSLIQGHDPTARLDQQVVTVPEPESMGMMQLRASTLHDAPAQITVLRYVAEPRHHQTALH